MNEDSYLLNMNGQEDFLPKSSQAQPVPSLLCEGTESDQT